MCEHGRTRAAILSVLLALPAAAAAETRYVSLSGSDLAGYPCLQPSSPCRTITAAVAAASAGDTIIVEAGEFVEPGTIGIGKTLTIEGAGVSNTTVKPKDAVTMFSVGKVTPQANVTIRGLEIRDAKEAIRNFGALTLENVEIVNSVNGAVINSGSLSMHGVSVYGTKGTGLDNYDSGFAYVTKSGFFNNVGTPGGIYNKGHLFMHASYVVDNEGVQAAGIVNNNLLYLTNTTISGNTASSTPGPSGTTGYSGGLTNLNGEAYLIHVTIRGNSGHFSGGVASRAGRVYLRNTIVHGNSAPQCKLHFDLGSGDITGGGNLVQDTSCNLWPASPAPNGGSANQVGFDGDPGLLPLSDYGGTLMHALLPGSAAIDGGYPPYCLAADQRGIGRPIDGDQDGTARCDIGAYEYNFEVGGGDRDGRAYWLYRGHWFRKGPSNHIGRGAPVRRE